MVVEEIDGVVNDVPVPIKVPAVKASYQLMVPELNVAPKTTVPAPQRLPGEVFKFEGIALTDAVIVVRDDVVHPATVAST